MKINSIYLQRLRNEEHFEFHTEFKALIVKHYIKELNEPLYSRYVIDYNMLDAALEIIRKSVRTDDLVQADSKRDETFYGLRHAVESAIRHFDADKRHAAQYLDNIFDHYGNIATVSRDQQTASIYNLIQELRMSNKGADLTTLGLTDWVNELEKNNKKYQETLEARYAEKEAQPERKMLEARNVIDAYYHNYCKFIEVHCTIIDPSEPNTQVMIKALNLRIAHYKELINRRAGARKKKDGEEEEVPPVVTGDTGPAEELPEGAQI